MYHVKCVSSAWHRVRVQPRLDLTMKCPQGTSLGDARRPLVTVPAPGLLTVSGEDKSTYGEQDVMMAEALGEMAVVLGEASRRYLCWA